ncbi:MAG: hypothetical protein JO215_09885 [Ktedonobacteraceae bacterium]|nr:hypothetical protein [Ktedonobacteraceae bacterium]
MFRKSLQVIQENRALYVWCNGGYYGLMLVTMLAMLAAPQIQEQYLAQSRTQVGIEGHVLSIVDATYISGSVLGAASVTFLINFFVGTLLFFTLPSILFPPAAIFLGAYRAIFWGVLYSPASAVIRQPHMLWTAGTLLLEGQGYILAIFAALVAFKGWLKPALYQQEGRLAGYWQGLKKAMPIYIPVILILALASVYEAVTVIYLQR